MKTKQQKIIKLISILSLFCFLIGHQVNAAEEKETSPTWMSIFIPGLGDYMNRNPKLGTFWLTSTMLIGAFHKNSVDNLHTQKDNYNQALDYGWIYTEDTTWTLYTISKFSNERSDLKKAYSQYNLTGNILITWWVLNFISAQINYPRLFKILNKDSTINLNIFRDNWNDGSKVRSRNNQGLSYEVELQWKF